MIGQILSGSHYRTNHDRTAATAVIKCPRQGRYDNTVRTNSHDKPRYRYDVADESVLLEPCLFQDGDEDYDGNRDITAGGDRWDCIYWLYWQSSAGYFPKVTSSIHLVR
jgi:hypothetical protein